MLEISGIHKIRESIKKDLYAYGEHHDGFTDDCNILHLRSTNSEG